MVFRKLSSAAAITAVVLTATACGSSSLPATDSAEDLERWVANTMPQPAEGGFSAAGNANPGGRYSSMISDVEQGEYSITVACTPTGSSAEPETASVRLGLGSGSAFYGDIDCSGSPVTGTTSIEAPSKSGPLDVVVRVETDTEALLWAVSASPTTSP